jgi:hypothetical protein
MTENINDHYTKCEKCRDRILKGDVKHMENGDDVCEYCKDSYEPEEYDEG